MSLHASVNYYSGMSLRDWCAGQALSGTHWPCVVPCVNYYSGMSLRDWFAGQALSGLAAMGPGRPDSVDIAVAEAYDYADGMLRERAKKLTEMVRHDEPVRAQTPEMEGKENEP